MNAPPAKPEPTARDLSRLVILDRYRRNFVIPNFTPDGWWECDVFELTEAGYFREYEVKVSRSDFRADAGKEKRLRDIDGHYDGPDRTSKHTRLAGGDPRGPVKFWYVAPPGIVPRNELPTFAGLLELDMDRWHKGHYGRLIEVVPAPQLHREKAPAGHWKQARLTTYWRMHNLLNGGRVGVDDEPADYVI